MDTVNVLERGQDRLSPYFVAIPFAMVLFGFYGTFLPFGFLGIAGFALVGALWALALGFVAKRLMQRQAWSRWLPNAPLFLAIIAIGFMAGGGVMYIFMMLSVLEVPATTYAILSALMQPAVPFFILINTALELLVMLLIVFLNWDAGRRRRWFSVAGVGLYLLMRIWTYLVYAETRLAISNQPLSAADVEWFRSTLVVDYRAVIELVSQGFLILAAMNPVRSK
jgi:hypothetical protein